MEINDAIINCKNALNGLFDSTNDVFLRLNQMLNENMAVVLIQVRDIPGTGQVVEYWILRDYTLTETTTTINTSPSFTIECTIEGQGIHGLALINGAMNPGLVHTFIMSAADDAADDAVESDFWTNKLVGQSIFFETGSLKVIPVFNITGELKAKSAIGLNTIKFDDDTIIMDEIHKDLLDKLIHWTNSYSVISQ